MPVSRRTFLALSAAAGAGAMLPLRPAHAAWRAGARSDDGKFFDWKPVAGPISVAYGFGGNSVAVDGRDIAYLIDTKNAPWGAPLLREAPKAAKLVVINSHHHADHTGGNHAFTSEHTVIAHEKCLPRIAMQMNRYVSQIKEGIKEIEGKKGPQVGAARTDWEALYKRVADLKAKEFTPTESIGVAKTLEGGAGEKILLHHFGPGHTDNDLVAHFPEHNVVHTGDLLFRRINPFIDAEGGATTTGWIDSLKKVIELCDAKTKVIPGHGDVCTIDGLREQVDYFEKMRDLVTKALKNGKTRKEVAEMKPSIFPGYAKEDFRGMALGAIYDELKAAK